MHRHMVTAGDTGRPQPSGVVALAPSKARSLTLFAIKKRKLLLNVAVDLDLLPAGVTPAEVSPTPTEDRVQFRYYICQSSGEMAARADHCFYSGTHRR